MQNIPMEIFSIAAWFTSVYFAFYKLHRPESKTRRRYLIALMAVWPLLPLVFSRLNIPRVNFFFTLPGLILFALLCGGSRRTIFTTVYYAGISLYIDTITVYFALAHTGQMEPRFTGAYYFFRGLSCALTVGWSYFYYRIMRKFTGKIAITCWFMTVLPSVYGLIMFYYYTSAVAAPLLERGVNIFFQSGALMTLLFMLNIFVFYTYISLAERARKQAAAVLLGIGEPIRPPRALLEYKNYDGMIQPAGPPVPAAPFDFPHIAASDSGYLRVITPDTAIDTVALVKEAEVCCVIWRRRNLSVLEVTLMGN